MEKNNPCLIFRNGFIWKNGVNSPLLCFSSEVQQCNTSWHCPYCYQSYNIIQLYYELSRLDLSGPGISNLMPFTISNSKYDSFNQYNITVYNMTNMWIENLKQHWINNESLLHSAIAWWTLWLWSWTSLSLFSPAKSG